MLTETAAKSLQSAPPLAATDDIPGRSGILVEVSTQLEDGCFILQLLMNVTLRLVESYRFQ